MSLLFFAGKRLLQSIPVLFAISVIAFAIIHLVPGDPARVMLGSRATEEAVATLRAQMGLDRPLLEQYAGFVAGAVQLEFGNSLFLKAPVGPILAARTGHSLSLVAYAVVISLLLALPFGLLAAVRQNRAADHIVRLFTSFAFAMPAFWTSLLLVLVFSIHFRIFPTSGLGDTPWSYVASLTLPAISLGLYLAPILLRSLRASLIDTLQADFVEAARARGLGEGRVLFKHVLRNSLIAMITVLGVNVGFLISGAVVIENVFSIPGLGSLMVSSVVSRDYPVIVALTLVFGIAVVIANLLVDMSYALFDPTIRQ